MAALVETQTGNRHESAHCWQLYIQNVKFLIPVIEQSSQRWLINPTVRFTVPVENPRTLGILSTETDGFNLSLRERNDPFDCNSTL